MVRSSREVFTSEGHLIKREGDLIFLDTTKAAQNEVSKLGQSILLAKRTSGCCETTWCANRVPDRIIMPFG